jgi:hypothetical protein
MKLQVNTSGAWRNVCEFTGDRYHEVKRVVEKIAPLTDADWCIVGPDGAREWINGGRSCGRELKRANP